MLQETLADLRLAISDQNLDLIPDYEQRLDVLRELRFIDENSTVLLKGRVACEVRSRNLTPPLFFFFLSFRVAD